MFRIEGLMTLFVLDIVCLSSDFDFRFLDYLMVFNMIDSLFFFQISSFSLFVLFFLCINSSI